MRETTEFRIDEEFASRLFAEDEGAKLGIGVSRKVVLARDDARYDRVGKLNRSIHRSTGGCFFYGWSIRRHYSKQEIAEATCFLLNGLGTFEPPGEMCGTQYDESTACPECGSGAAQTSELVLDLRKAPKSKDIAATIANEIIVSQRLGERMVDAGLTGFELSPVRHKGRYQDDPIDFRLLPTGRKLLEMAEAAGAPHGNPLFYVWVNRKDNHILLQKARMENAKLRRKARRHKDAMMPVWHQLVVKSASAEIVAPTRVGIDPFDADPDGQHRCSRGDLIGLNLLSEVSISAASRVNADVFCSGQFVGDRGGVLRPRRLIFISPKFRELILSVNPKGVIFEVAHVV